MSDSSHQDAIDQFKAISGIEGDQDNDKIGQLLTIHDQNLNNAISQYFDLGFDAIGSANITASASTTTIDDHPDVPDTSSRTEAVNLQSQMFMDAIMPRLPKAPRISSSWHLEVGIHASLSEKNDEKSEKLLQDDSQYPSARKPAWKSFWIILLFIPKTLLSVLFSAVKQLFGLNHFAKLAPNRFPSAFNYSKYQPQLDWDHPDRSDFNIIDSDFNAAYDSAQKGFVWLLVVLVNDSEENRSFTNSLVQNPYFKSLFDKESGTYKDTIIYLNNVETSREAYEIGKTYKVKRLPYIMLIGNVSSNPQTILSSMSILYKSNLASHFISPELQSATSSKILRNLDKLLESFSPQMISARFDQQEIEFARLIKQQQDDAYVQSLERDRIKKLQKQKEAEESLALRTSAIVRAVYLSKQLQEPSLLQGSSQASSRIAIKLPTGKRMVETVDKSLPVSRIYMYLELELFRTKQDSEEVQEFLAEATPEHNDEADLLTADTYHEKYPFKFELVQPFPKKIIECSSQLVSDTPELASGANLLVEYTEEDEDDEDS